MLSSKDLKGVLEEMNRLKESEKEAQEQVLQMQNLIRKQRMVENFKHVCAQKKWQTKLETLQKQLTQNADLWEQLAESQKRERVLKQELENLQTQAQQQMRIIDRFKDEMSSISSNNKKLTDFFSENERKLKTMEARLKNVDTYDHVSIPKVIRVVEQKQRRIEELERAQKHQFASIDKTLRTIRSKVRLEQSKTSAETKYKDIAFQKIHELRHITASASQVFSLQSDRS